VFVLADHGETQPLDDTRLSTGFAVQEVQYFRATEVVFFHRGLHRFEEVVHVTRKHGSDALAELAMLDGQGIANLRGLITFEVKSPGGNVARRYLRNAIVTLVSQWNIGASTEHVYRIMGGKITTQP
jgi:hypothetical protein